MYTSHHGASYFHLAAFIVIIKLVSTLSFTTLSWDLMASSASNTNEPCSFSTVVVRSFDTQLYLCTSGCSFVANVHDKCFKCLIEILGPTKSGMMKKGVGVGQGGGD